ncbi:hypothetical protein QE152_g26788 [Popillia japonica]|uniref:DDE-1 domain-containing protein n=1 Tax=Popillia japonica TaxID=7064 RepID=A0AAW1JWK9_POPJA
MLVLQIIENIEEGKKEFNINLLEAIRLIDRSWNKVTQTTIKNCFIHAGFLNRENEIEVHSDSDNEEFTIENNLPLAKYMKLFGDKSVTMKDYVEVDDAIITNQLLTDTEITCLASTSMSEDKNIESASEESDNDIAHQTGADIVTIHRARQSLEVMRTFFQNSKHTVAAGSLDLLTQIENNMDEISTFHIRQSKITDFFNV